MAHSSTVIPGFTRVANNVSLYRPQDNTSQRLASTPSLIVLCSWMGAGPKHIAKYTAGYQKLYPDLAILLVESSMADTWASDAKQRERLAVAANIVVAFKKDLENKGVIQLHAMSNGGGIAATRIAAIIGNSKIFDKIILDCLPGRPNVNEGVRAISVGLPKNAIIRFLGGLLIRLYMYVGLYIMKLLNKEDMLTRLRRLLNDPNLFDKGTERLYMFSKNDQLVGYNDVHDHASKAKELGFQNVKRVIFEQAPHCALVMEDATSYWNAVTELPSKTKGLE